MPWAGQEVFTFQRTARRQRLMFQLFSPSGLGGFLPVYAIFFIINIILKILTGQFDLADPTMAGS
jgi:hypothetical protein